MRALLDTHILLYWLGDRSRLSQAQIDQIEQADAETPLLLSHISLWEVATLHALGRIQLDRPLREWLELASAPPLVRRLGISPAVAAQVAGLPATFHRDRADRIIVATAIVHGASLVTADGRIRESGLVPVI